MVVATVVHPSKSPQSLSLRSMLTLRVTPVYSSLLLMKFRPLLTWLQVMSLSPPKRSKTGTRRINLKMNVSHSIPGLLKTRKSLRLFFCLPVLFREPRTTSTSSLRVSRNSTGFGNKSLLMSLKLSTRTILNLKTMRRSFAVSRISSKKLTPLQALTLLVLFHSRPKMLSLA